ncbi:recombinase family protein [Limnobaculum sp. M2-1]|uniref:recombinase family protein n=1 Tax=Limnobaculum sp. M2-1 TaxID=2855838 RepID=UPI002AA550E8|nr:recombinase family protein [Limnobaculum sp. M2-1]
MISEKNTKIESDYEIPVAQYLRMSTDNQKYSLYNQKLFIRKYAAENGMVIVKTYQDEGKSGLTVSGRQGLQNLIEDVTQHKLNVEAILVYDVSRFGRFQDPDESGFYDFLLKKSGIPVIYCAEPVSKDNPEMSSLYLVIQRHAAAAYSKNLSEKVFAGQKNLIKRGYRQGGVAGFGLRRLLVDENNNSKGILSSGQRKSLQSDRVILTKGSESEVSIINYIYSEFVNNKKNENDIAVELNKSPQYNKYDFKWTKGRVHQILTNEKYIGNNVFNKTSFKLKKKHVKNPESSWVRKDNAFESLVSKEIFYKAREIILNRSNKFSDSELLDNLKLLLAQKGLLSGIIIDEDKICPSSCVYRNRFGGLLNAYKLVGYTPKRDYQYLKINNYLRSIYYNESQKIINAISLHGGWCEDSGFDNIIKVNDEFYLSITISKCKTLSSGNRRWRIRFSNQNICDINLIIRMNSDNYSALDFYIFPSIDCLTSDTLLKDINSANLELYRFNSLELFYSIISRKSIKDNLWNYQNMTLY